MSIEVQKTGPVEDLSHAHVFATLGVLAGLYVLTAYLTGAGLVDDAYIFLRYARNIWVGHGPVFNIGEAVEGYTSPLWLALLTLSLSIPVAAPKIAAGAGAVVGFLLVLLVALRSGVHGRIATLIGASFLASNPAFVYWAWSGMDTAVFSLLVAVTVLSLEYRMERHGSLLVPGVWFGLTALARLEALWMAPVFVLFIARRYLSSRHVMKAFLEISAPGVFLIGCHLLWRHEYYGVWLPNTYYAKVSVPMGPKLLHGLVYFLDAAQGFAPLIAVLVIGMRRVNHADRRMLVPLAMVIGWWLVYVIAVGGDHFAMFRFMVPALGLVAIFGTRLAAVLMDRIRPTSVSIAVVLVIVVNGFMLTHRDRAVGSSEVQLARSWARLGQWCADNLPPGSIATLVIGAIPYYCDREILDIVGLVDAHIARYGDVFPDSAMGHQKHDTQYVLSRAPHYILFPTLARSPLFATVESRRKIPERTARPFMDLVTNPQTVALYEYRAERLEDGSWVEFLERRASRPYCKTSRVGGGEAPTPSMWEGPRPLPASASSGAADVADAIGTHSWPPDSSPLRRDTPSAEAQRPSRPARGMTTRVSFSHPCESEAKSTHPAPMPHGWAADGRRTLSGVHPAQALDLGADQRRLVGVGESAGPSVVGEPARHRAPRGTEPISSRGSVDGT